MKSFSSFIKLFFFLLLSWQIGIGLPVAMAKQSYPGLRNSSPNVSASVNKEELTSGLLTSFQQEVHRALPLLEEFKQAPWPRDLISTFNPSEEGLDEDPFFLRSQSWRAVEGLKGEGDWSFSLSSKSVTLTHSNWRKSLEIQAPILPLIETAEYILFSVREDSDLVESKVPSLKESSQGLFFISKRDLLAQYHSAEALNFDEQQAIGAPLFFFPLPEEGWKGNLQVVEWLANDEVILRNQLDQSILPVELKDFQLLEKIQRANLLMAQVITLFDEREERLQQAAHHMKATGEISPFVMPLPSAKATKGFGLFLSGKKPRAFMGGSKEAQIHPLNLNSSLWKKIQQSLLPEARAEGFLESIQSMITPDFWERVHFLNTLLFGAAVGSVALKYSTYRDLFKKKYPAVKKTLKEKIWNEAKGNLDVYTHMLVTVSFSVGMSIVTSVEYLIDRFATKSAGPKNGLVRWMFNNTLGWSRAQTSQLATNWKTFMLGALVMGGIDSALVVVQLLFVTPFVIEKMGWDMTTGVAAGTSAVAAFVTAEILHNIYAYFKTGAFSYSADQKFLVMDQVRMLADRELKRKGLDPTAREVQFERNRRIRELMNERMTQMGLPSDKDFLFDHNTLIEKVVQASGYGLTKEELSLLKDEVVLQTGRWGLAYPTLKKAHRAALSLQKKSPSAKADETVLTLSKSLEDFRISESFIKKAAESLIRGRTQSAEQLELPLGEEPTSSERYQNFSKNPGFYLKAMVQNLSKRASRSAKKMGSDLESATVGASRDVRKVISLMTYNGSVQDVLPLLPSEFIEMAGSKESAENAARLIHNAFFSITQGDESLLTPSSDSYSQFSEEAEEILKFRHKGQTRDAFTKSLEKIEVIKTLQAEAKKENFVQTFKPAKKGWFERLQHQRAKKFAEQKMMAEATNENSDLDSATQEKNYRRDYLKRLSHLSGLYLVDFEESEFTSLVEERALEAFHFQMNLPEEQRYIKELDEKTAQSYRAQVFTDHFFDFYFQMSVMTDKHLKPDAPEQPGRFQKLRQKLIGKPGYDKIYRRILRTTEGLYEDTVFRPGLVNFISGKVPIIPEMVKVFFRNLHLLPYFMTFGYFTNYYLWQVKMDYAVWVFYFLLAFYGPTAVAVNNRIMKNFGIKPMGDVWSKVKYTIYHSWLTWPAFIPVMMFADPIVNWWNTNITEPIYSVMSFCAQLLSGP